MKKLIKPASLALYLLMFIVFFIVGLFYANWIEAGKDQMLAAAAIVLGWGVLFGGIAFTCALFIAYNTSTKFVRLTNWALLILLIILIGIARFLNPRGDDAEEKKQPKSTSPNFDTRFTLLAEPATLLTAISTEKRTTNKISNKLQQNLGFFKPNFYDNRTLYFYGGANLQKGLMEHTPQDSVVFELDQNGNFTTSYAPPWLVPEHMVLDYGIIYFKVRSVGYDFLKVITNKKEERIAYLDKHAGELLFWPQFLLSVNTVEFPEGKEQPVKIKPLDHASEVNIEFVFMKPILVGDKWMKVVLLDDDFRDLGKGWIRWQKDGELLIRYSLLS